MGEVVLDLFDPPFLQLAGQARGTQDGPASMPQGVEPPPRQRECLMAVLAGHLGEVELVLRSCDGRFGELMTQAALAQDRLAPLLQFIVPGPGDRECEPTLGTQDPDEPPLAIAVRASLLADLCRP